MQKFNINLVKSFLSVFIRFAKNKFAITMGFNPLRLFVFAHNGLKPHCYKKWIATPHTVCLTASARNDNKNNFANLNLVKTFLTSITFDSLSEKIKNLRLVIKKIKTMEDIHMRNIKKIFIVVFSLILLFAVSCSNDDKTGVKNNPPENDTEITDGETGSSGGSSGGSEMGESGKGGSEEGDSGEVTPPSELETTEEGYFPPPEGDYRYDSRRQNYIGSCFEPTVSYIAGEKTKIEGTLIIHGSDGGEDGKYRGGHSDLTVSKWKKTTKNGKITKTEAVEIEGKILVSGRNETPTFSEVIYDYETKTLSITCKVTTKDGIKKILSTKSKKY